MSVARFYVQGLEVGQVRLSGQEARHARQSRRLSVHDDVVLIDGRGREGRGRIARIDASEVQVEVERVERRERPLPMLTIATAIPKGPRQDVLVEKCTELGAAAIWPLMTERGVASASAHRIAKWHRAAIEAAKQSGQAWIPEIREPRCLDDILDDGHTFDRILAGVTAGQSDPVGPGGAPRAPDLPHLDSPPQRLVDLLADLAGVRSILAAIGPEGGWTDLELSSMYGSGAIGVSLGPNTLRIETAAIAMAAAVHALQQSR